MSECSEEDDLHATHRHRDCEAHYCTQYRISGLSLPLLRRTRTGNGAGAGAGTGYCAGTRLLINSLTVRAQL